MIAFCGWSTRGAPSAFSVTGGQSRSVSNTRLLNRPKITAAFTTDVIAN